MFTNNTNITTLSALRPFLAPVCSSGFMLPFATATKSLRTGFLLFCFCITALLWPYQSQAAGTAFRVNAIAEGDQDKLAISPLKQGGFVAAYASAQSGTSKIHVRRYQSDGSADGEAIHVTMGTPDAEWEPAVAGLNDGGFVVVWRAMVNGDPNIYVQRFNVDGSAELGPLAVLTEAKDQLTPTVSALNNGGFVVSWTHEQIIPFTFDISAQQFNSDGTRQGTVFEVNTVTIATQHDPAISPTQDGGYFIFWATHNQHSQENGIYAQRYSSQGTSIGEEFEVMQGAYNEPTSSALVGGGVVVAWADTTAQGKYKIVARLYTDDGTALGSFIDISLPSTEQLQIPRVTGLSDGGFAVTWQQNTAERQVIARAFAPDGTAKGEAFVVDSTIAGAQTNPVVSALSDEQYIVGWTQFDGDNKDVLAKRFGHSNQFSLLLPTQTIYVGDEISLDIVASGNGVYGIDGELTVIDTAKFGVVAGSYGDFFDSAQTIGLNGLVSESRWHGALSLKEPAVAKTGSGIYASVTLKAQAVGSSELVLKGLFSTRDGQVLLEHHSTVTLTVVGAVTISGNVRDYGYSGDVGGLLLTIDGQQVEINADGSFNIKTAAGGHLVKIIAPGFLTWTKALDLMSDTSQVDLGSVSLVAGDSNGDNKIDIADLTMLLGAYGSRESEGGNYFAEADFNADSIINIQDLSILGGNFGRQAQ